MVKDLMRVHLIRKCSYFCDTHFQIITGSMADYVIPGHINFGNTYISIQIQHKGGLVLLSDSASHAI